MQLRSTTHSLLLTLVFLLVAPGIPAQDASNGSVKLPGGGMDFARMAGLQRAGWTVEGKRALVERPGSEGSRIGKRDGALLLEPGAVLRREVEVAPIVRPKGKAGQIDPGRWTTVLTASLGRPAGTESDGEVRVRLTREVPAESRRRLAGQGRTRGEGWTGRLLLQAPSETLEPGTWTLEVRVTGDAPVLLDDLSLVRVPTHPAEMHFAKSNGKNGPDRLLSGALGFTGHAANDHAPLPVKAVRAGGPAAAAGLTPGDLILAIDGEVLRPSSARPGWHWFERGHEARLARAVAAAHARGATTGSKNERVRLEILREGTTRTLELPLAVRPALPETFPFGEGSAGAFEKDLIRYVRENQKPDGSWSIDGNAWIQTTFGGLALLGHRDPQDARAIEAAALWYLRRFPDAESLGNLGYWAAGYGGIFLTEYYLASGDVRVRPWIERALEWVSGGYHTTKWKYAGLGHGPNGIPYGNKALIAPASHLLVFEALAVKAGWPSAIRERLDTYLKATWSDPADGGHGAMGYNPSYRDQGEFWSRTGLCSLAMTLRGEDETMRAGMTAVMERRHAWMRNSHAYGYPGASWGLIGLARADLEAFRRVMSEWRSIYGGMWEPGFGLRVSEAHMGSPYMGREGLVNLTTAALLSVRRQGLVMTGADPSEAGWLRPSGAPSAPGAVRITRRPDGAIVVLPVVPGEMVVVTTDGSEPTASSPRFTAPIDLPAGGVVLARTLRKDGALGPVARRTCGLAKSGWRILEAGGASSKEDAIRRARAWIDMDPRRPWQPDRGEGSKEWPLRVVIDLGEPQIIAGLRFDGPNPPGAVRVETRVKADDRDASLTDHMVENRQILFGRLRTVRYLTVEITKFAKNGRARLGELSLVWPSCEIGGDEDGFQVLPARQDGLRVRWLKERTLDGRSAVFEGQARIEASGPIHLRLEDAGGRPVGPIRVFGG